MLQRQKQDHGVGERGFPGCVICGVSFWSPSLRSLLVNGNPEKRACLPGKPVVHAVLCLSDHEALFVDL